MKEELGTGKEPTEPVPATTPLEVDGAVLRTALDSAPAYVSFFDTDLRLRYISRATKEDLAKFVGARAADLIPPQQLPRLTSAMQEAADLGTQPEVEYFTDPEGGRRWYMSRISAMRDQEGALIGFVLVTTDLTDQKGKAQLLRKIKVDLVEMLQEAGGADVAAGVLHEISHLLRSVDASTSLLMEELASPHVELLARTVALCQEQGENLPGFLVRDARGQKVMALLGRVTEELLGEQRRLVAEVERLEEEMTMVRSTLVAQQTLASAAKQIEETEPSELIERALAAFRGDLAQKRIDAVVEITDDTRILTDKQATLQILSNLIRNAIDALADVQGRRVLRVGMRVEGDHAHFEVADNGCGISAGDLARLFRQGFTTKKRGHGFALHASAIAAQAMGGSLQAHSEGTGRGARFRLTLPRASVQPA